MTKTASAQIVKTYADGTGEIDTLPVDVARAHVKTRTADAHAFGIVEIKVRVDGGVWHRWSITCDRAEIEHPGFACNHPGSWDCEVAA